MIDGICKSGSYIRMLDHYCPDTAYGTPWPIGGQNSPCIGVINIDLSAGAAGTIFFTAPFDNVKSVSVPAPGPKTRTTTRFSWVSTTQDSLKAIGSISTVVSAGARLTALPSGHEKSVYLGTAIFVPGSASPKLMTFEGHSGLPTTFMVGGYISKKNKHAVSGGTSCAAA